MADYLKIDHVDKSFRRGATESAVLKDVNLVVDKGEFVSIIGHSGCGKSTLLNLIAGLTQVSAGAVLFEEREVNAPGPERAVVFQNHSLLPWLSVYDNVALAVNKVFGATKSRAERHEWVTHNLDLVQMSAAKDKRPGGNLGRHEAARRHRARARHGAQSLVARRTVRRARRADARAPPGFGDGDPCDVEEHHDHDHA